MNQAFENAGRDLSQEDQQAAVVDAAKKAVRRGLTTEARGAAPSAIADAVAAVIGAIDEAADGKPDALQSADFEPARSVIDDYCASPSSR